MKKLILMTGFFGMVFLKVQTQPVIEAGGFNTLQGSKTILKTAPVGYFIALGEDVTWNFSSLNPIDSDTLECVSLESVCDDAFLPGGSMHGVYQYSNFSYFFRKTQEVRNFNISTEGFFIEGGGICEGEFTVYTDMKQLMGFPLTYYSDCFDSYEGAIVNQPGTDFTGTISTETPSYGTLILPNMTFTNVLLLVSLDIRQLPSAEPDTTNKVYFFEPSIPYPVLEITNFNKWVYFDDIINSSIPYHTGDRHIEIFPNPAKDYVVVRWAKPCEMISYEIIDFLGQTVYRRDKHQTDNNSLKIDLNQINPGTYFITFILDDMIFTEKVVKI